MSDASVRWRRVEELCHAALQRDASDRAAFLEAACGDDLALRREVEALLAHEQTANGFLETPVGAAAAQVMSDGAPESWVGRRIGAYQIVSPLGAGGMGEVYRARDTQLGREVAIKVLPAAFTADRERLSRFEREARMLASLNHPHIGAIYGVEESAGVRALILELVEGPTLSDRLAKGPIPLKESLGIVRQIADALETAHAKGIVHRDLKPANIKITPGGMVKVLDFGLAKAVAGDGLAGASPSPALTFSGSHEGVILGTAAYMSPEQARGQAVEKRTDIWAFGCVLYEMLTGRMAFPGDTVSDCIAAILERDPDWTALPEAMPPDLRRVLRRCLAKDPTRRLQAIGDARLEIEDLLSNVSEESAGTMPSNSLPRLRRALPWALLGAALAWTGVALWAPWRTTVPPATLRLNVALGSDVVLASGVGNSAILSPDAAFLAFVAHKADGESPQLYVRSLDQLQAKPLAGTDGAEGLFFSPDGQWIGFFAGGKLKKAAVTGGAVVTLCDVPGHRGGAWGEDGTIVFSYAGPGVSLKRVSSAGGTPETLTSLAEGEVTHRWPQVLAGGKAVLYTSHGNSVAFDDANLVVQPLPSGDRKVVQRGGSYGRYLPSGHLIYVSGGTLFAVPFDLDRLEVRGQPVPVLEGVKSDAGAGDAQFAVSTAGTLVYVPGQSTSTGAPIHWMNQTGMTTPLRALRANWFEARFAPDGSRLAVRIIDAQSVVWVYDWARDTLTRVTASSGAWPVWTPDGHRIVFASRPARQTTSNLYWQHADGTGEAERLTESKNLQLPTSWHPSGKFLAFFEQTSKDNDDLMILPMEGDNAVGWKAGRPTVFLNSPFNEREPTFSPDGRWLAYRSDESGRHEVFVQPFPGPGSRWQISTGGGDYPVWSRTKRELFYGTPDGQIMVAAFIVEGDSFRAAKPRLWSNGRYVSDRGFDLHPDGEQFALAPAAPEHGGTKQGEVVFILNFFDELRRIAPAGRK